MKIAVWGDSIAYGAHDYDQGGWVNRLKMFLAKESNGSISLYNLGISGERVAHILERFNREYDELNPDIIILAIGINDSAHNTYPQGTPLDVFEQRYSDLISQMKVTKKPVIIVGPTNVDDEHKKVGGRNNKSIKQYEEIIKTIANKNKLLYVDLWDVIPPRDLQIDGLHPDSNGHEKIFQLVRKAVQLRI